MHLSKILAFFDSKRVWFLLATIIAISIAITASTVAYSANFANVQGLFGTTIQSESRETYKNQKGSTDSTNTFQEAVQKSQAQSLASFESITGASKSLSTQAVAKSLQVSASQAPTSQPSSSTTISNYSVSQSSSTSIPVLSSEQNSLSAFPQNNPAPPVIDELQRAADQKACLDNFLHGSYALLQAELQKEGQILLIKNKLNNDIMNLRAAAARDFKNSSKYATAELELSLQANQQINVIVSARTQQWQANVNKASQLHCKNVLGY